MKLSIRYGLVSIGALATLSFVHWARERPKPESEILLYLLGVLPNITAAVAIPFVLLGIWADQNVVASYSRAKRSCSIAVLFSTLGLIGWEFLQQGSRNMVFDPHDIGATVLGSCIAVGLFLLLTPRKTGRSTEPLS